MANHTIILSEVALDIRLVKKHARQIKSERISCANHPAVQALPDLEREIWILHCNNVMGREIASMLGIRKDVVSRTLANIRSKFEFLASFRKILEAHPALKARFYALSK